jgi:hypothetical protein
MDVMPVLNDHNAGNGDGEKDSKGCGYLNRQDEGEQGNRYECLSKTEGRADQCGEEDDGENPDNQQAINHQPLGVAGEMY